MQILYFTTASGNQPARKYIAALKGRDLDEMDAAILALEADGLDAAGVDLKHVEGKLWEIRTSSQRVFYVIVTGPAMVILHAYKKQGQKAPKNDLDIARERAKLVLEH